MSNYLILVASDPETWLQNKEKQSVSISHIWQCCLWQIPCRTRSSFESWSQSWAAPWETIWLLFANTAVQFILWVGPGDWLRPQLQSVIVDTVLCAHDNVYIKGRERRPPSKQTHIQPPTPPPTLAFNEWEAPNDTEHIVYAPSLSLTFNGDYVLSNLVLEGQVIDALDQVVDCVNVRVDRLEPMDLCPDGRWVGQNKLRARWAGLGSLARNSPRTELASPWTRRRSGSELGRDRLGDWDGNCHRDRAWSGHGWLRLLRDAGHWDARLEIHLVFFLSLLERLTLLQPQHEYAD